jgi:hypothetical protein
MAFDDTTEAAMLCTCGHPALTHMHAVPANGEWCRAPGCLCVEFTGAAISGTYQGTEDLLPGVVETPLTLAGLPVVLDSSLCDPGEVWLTGPDGDAVRVWPPSEEKPDA